jgi:hypothetical protein
VERDAGLDSVATCLLGGKPGANEQLAGSTIAAILGHDHKATSDTIARLPGSNDIVSVWPELAGGKQAVAHRLVDTVTLHRKAA